MANIFEPVIEKMFDLGVYDVFIFVLVVAIFYAILKKTKILGGSPVIDGAISLSIGFLVLGFQWLTGMALTGPFTILFTQTTMILLFLFIGFLAASMFYPDMTKFLVKTFTSRSVIFIMIALGFTLLVTSGMIQTFWASAAAPPQPGEARISNDILIVAAGLIIFVVLLIIVAGIAGGGK